jgi:hypothetical protein
MLHVQNDLPFKSHFFLKRNFVTESLSPLVLLPLEMALRLTCSQDFATRIEDGWAKLLPRIFQKYTRWKMILEIYPKND